MGLTMQRSSLVLCLILGLLGTTLPSYGQATAGKVGSVDFNDEGIVFTTADSSSKVAMRFRMQNQVVINTKDEDITNIASTEMAVRRLRLRFGGTLFDPRLFFNLQLSFSRGDIDLADTQFPNTVRDAVAGWAFSPDFQVSLGQTKLPGNRQRVISSADLLYFERSIVNGAFTLDRDFGLFANYRLWIGDAPIWFKGAVSSGDGRNQSRIIGDGIAWTGRVEVLPFGNFTKGGDYFEGDLLRERTPKLSLAFTAHANNRHTRTRGTLGPLLYAQRSSTILYADALLKYRGLALYGEWATRSCDDPITKSPDGTKTQAVFVGNGYMGQATYLLPFDLELGARLATVHPGDAMRGLPEGFNATTISGMAVYHIKGHRIKLMSEVIHDHQENLASLATLDFWTIRLGMELGI
jgi:phosphate-selective porin OprO/OprP